MSSRLIRILSNPLPWVGSLVVSLLVMIAPAPALRPPDLVELIQLDPTLKLDIRYARADNFVGRPVYSQARAFLQRPAAVALVRVHRRLRSQGLGLLIFDGYRPLAVTRLFWELTPPAKRMFVADPRRGSRHNRGCAVDLSLFELASGEPVAMPSDFDEMTERSHIDYPGGSAAARKHRTLLREAMASEGFAVYPPEWWHYDHRDWRQYPILDLTFAQISPSP